METIIRKFRELDPGARSAIERLVGHSLAENQQLVIQVMNLDLAEIEAGTGTGSRALPEWCRVYEGLSESEVEAVEEVALTRANLNRNPD